MFIKQMFLNRNNIIKFVEKKLFGHDKEVNNEYLRKGHNKQTRHGHTRTRSIYPI